MRLYISDRLIHLAELYTKGKELFDSFDHFNEWLSRPSIDLGGDKPIDLIQSRTGVDQLLTGLEARPISLRQEIAGNDPIKKELKVNWREIAGI